MGKKSLWLIVLAVVFAAGCILISCGGSTGGGGGGGEKVNTLNQILTGAPTAKVTGGNVNHLLKELDDAGKLATAAPLGNDFSCTDLETNLDETCKSSGEVTVDPCTSEDPPNFQINFNECMWDDDESGLEGTLDITVDALSDRLMSIVYTDFVITALGIAYPVTPNPLAINVFVTDSGRTLGYGVVGVNVTVQGEDADGDPCTEVVTVTLVDADTMTWTTPTGGCGLPDGPITIGRP